MNSTDVLLCRPAKWAKKYEIILGLPSQILIYYWVGKQSKPSIKKTTEMSNASQKCQIVLVLLSYNLIYFCVGKRSEPKNIKK